MATATNTTYGNLFDGVSVNWGFQAGDVFTNGMFLVGSVAAFVLLGIAIRYVPALIQTIRGAATYKALTGRGHTASSFWSDVKMHVDENKEMRAARRGRR